MSPTVAAALVGVAVPLGILAYLLIGEKALKNLPPRKARGIRIVLWLIPAFILMIITLIYPLLRTVLLSFQDAKGTAFVAFGNYVELLGREDFLISIRNNLLWLVVYTAFVTVIGLAVATLADKIRYERLVRTLVVLPTAISFVGAGVIWGFVYAYTPPGLPQTGTLNAIWTLFPGVDPIAWLQDENTVNGALIFIGIWMSVGLATVILTAAIKGVPGETLEAARIDGASEWATFFRILLPQISSTVVVVITLMAINALKVFEIIYVLTNGNYNSQVLATSMYAEMFVAQNTGTASAIAVILLLATIPVIAVNVKSFREQS
jgi:alpha-glucoside transport system permease protein